MKEFGKNSPIGFFDSGVGGLSVYSRFKKVLPNENTLYFGDLAHLPYGNKTQEELISYARGILKFYEQKGVKAVVIACNTSSAQAYDIVKKEFDFKIYPIIQSCAKVIANSEVKCLGVFATSATVNSGVYTRELKKHNPMLEVKEIACSNWVDIVENGKYKDTSARADIKSHLDDMMKFSPEKIILGCTHYPYLLPILRELEPNVEFIDPAEIFVNYIKNDMTDLLNDNNSLGTEEIFVSANPENFLEHSGIFYKIKEIPKLYKSNNK